MSVDILQQYDSKVQSAERLKIEPGWLSMTRSRKFLKHKEENGSKIFLDLAGFPEPSSPNSVKDMAGRPRAIPVLILVNGVMIFDPQRRLSQVWSTDFLSISYDHVIQTLRIYGLLVQFEQIIKMYQK